MTTLHYVKKARKNIYRNGVKVERVNKKGQKVTKYDTSKPQNKQDELIVEQGEGYYWWQFAFRSKQISKQHPRRSQYMTQSEHLGNIYDIEDQLHEMKAEDLVDGCLDDMLADIESVRDNCQERLDNMPEQLQEAPTGQILQDYIDNLESWQSELEGVDLSDLDDDFHANAEGEVDENDYMIDGEFDEESYQSAITDRAEELEEEARQSIIDELPDYPG